jgi:hypothetical protein
MAAEEHHQTGKEVHPNPHVAADGRASFDELAKGLASGTVSRRKALKMLGAALVGGAFASMPGVAWAAKGGNSECIRCCKETFDPGRERQQCISAGAHGECPVTCDGNGGGGGCPPGSLPPVSEQTTCGPLTAGGGCGVSCLWNECTGEINCVCCPIGGPCPCLTPPDPQPACIRFTAACPGPQECYNTANPPESTIGLNIPCPGPHNPGCDQSPICLAPL